MFLKTSMHIALRLTFQNDLFRCFFFLHFIFVSQQFVKRFALFGQRMKQMFYAININSMILFTVKLVLCHTNDTAQHQRASEREKYRWHINLSENWWIYCRTCLAWGMAMQQQKVGQEEIPFFILFATNTQKQYERKNEMKTTKNKRNLS